MFSKAKVTRQHLEKVHKEPLVTSTISMTADGFCNQHRRIRAFHMCVHFEYRLNADRVIGKTHVQLLVQNLIDCQERLTDHFRGRVVQSCWSVGHKGMWKAGIGCRWHCEEKNPWRENCERDSFSSNGRDGVCECCSRLWHLHREEVRDLRKNFHGVLPTPLGFLDKRDVGTYQSCCRFESLAPFGQFRGWNYSYSDMMRDCLDLGGPGCHATWNKLFWQ